MRVAVETFRQRRNVGGYESHGLRGEAAERALIAAMAERAMLAGRALIVDVDAEFRRVAENRLELGSDRRVIRADKGGRSDRRRRRSGEQLKDERECNDKYGRQRAPARQPIAGPPRSAPRSSVAVGQREYPTSSAPND